MASKVAPAPHSVADILDEAAELIGEEEPPLSSATEDFPETKDVASRSGPTHNKASLSSVQMTDESTGPLSTFALFQHATADEKRRFLVGFVAAVLDGSTIPLVCYFLGDLMSGECVLRVTVCLMVFVGLYIPDPGSILFGISPDANHDSYGIG